MRFHLSSFALLLSYVALASAIRLPRVMTSNMVVAAERPVVFGWSSTPGARVSGTMSDTGEVVTVTSDAVHGRFQLEFEPRNASLVAFDMRIDDADDRSSATLANLLAGDLWVCSGQSNMEFALATMFNAETVIANSDKPGLRLFAVQKNQSSEPLDDLQDVQYQEGWVEAKPSTVCGSEYSKDPRYCQSHCNGGGLTWGYFSALCFVHGVALLEATGRPQGMVATAWGGSRIEPWSSAAASAKCGKSVNGQMWAGMVHPLLPLPVRGVLWYQGESNSFNGVPVANNYKCQLQALVEDWRTGFARHPLGNLTFVVMQVAPQGDSTDGALRLAQQQVSLDLDGVPVVITADLYDQHSPCHPIHPRDKQTMGERAARASLAVAYGRQEQAWTGPIPTSFSYGNAGDLIIDFGAVAGGVLSFETVEGQTSSAGLQNFEVTSDVGLVAGWSTVQASIVSPTRVAIAATSSALSGLRYSWGNVPRGQFLYDDSHLPAGPFLAQCDNIGCKLVLGGQVPFNSTSPSQDHVEVPAYV